MKEYIYSQWNVTHPIKREIVILNTLTSAGIIIEKDDFEKLQNGMLDHLDKDLFEKLIANGFIVSRKKEENESATFWRLYHNIKYRSVLKCLHLVIIPTYKCNFRCKYCFEDLDMLEHVEDNLMDSKLLIDWIQKFKIAYKFRSLKVVFYGGEPLYNKERLKNYMKALKKWSDVSKVMFSFSIITSVYPEIGLIVMCRSVAFSSIAA